MYYELVDLIFKRINSNIKTLNQLFLENMRKERVYFQKTKHLLACTYFLLF